MVRRLLYLNGLAAMAVVLYHASSWGFISMIWWAYRYRPVGEVNFDQLGTLEYYGLRMVEQLVIFAIPAFVLVSGYFIAIATGRDQKTIGWDVIFNRIKFLAIPFLLWSVISMLFSMLLGERYTVRSFFVTILTGRAANPFYFIPMLMQLYLLSPLLVFLVRKSWKHVLIVAAIIQVAVLSFRYAGILYADLWLFARLSEGIWFTSYVFWFILGIVIGFHLTEFKGAVAKYRHWILAGVFVFYVAGVLEWEMLLRLSGKPWIGPEETLIDQGYALFFILAFLAFEKVRLPRMDPVTYVGSRSYAIYLVHTLVLISTAKLVFRVIPAIMEYQLLYQAILISLGLGVPLLLAVAVEKSVFRPYYRLIFG